jgi:hypothetical protein
MGPIAAKRACLQVGEISKFVCSVLHQSLCDWRDPASSFVENHGYCRGGQSCSLSNIANRDHAVVPPKSLKRPVDRYTDSRLFCHWKIVICQRRRKNAGDFYEKRRGDRNSIGWPVSPASARSARISPITGANLKPCPENPQAIETWEYRGWSPTTKC